MDHTPAQPRRTVGDILTVGFGTAVAMWAAGYVCRLPTLQVPAPVVAVLALLCLVVGGVFAGRYSPRGWPAGGYAGLVTSVLNLLVLGSFLGQETQPNRIVPSAAWWIPGSILVGMGLGGVGGVVTG